MEMNETTNITINGTPTKLVTIKIKSDIKETETVVVEEYENNMCSMIPEHLEHDAYLKMTEMINNILVSDNNLVI